MDTFQLRVFQNQVYLQCRFILQAVELLADPEQVWFALQSLLDSTANASKALWGSGGKYSEQRFELRESIGVKENSPLKLTTMRNHWEHFDERIDTWWEKSSQHNNIDLNIGVMNPGFDSIDVFRNWDPETLKLIFWGEIFDVGKIIAEVVRIMPVLVIETSKPHWIS